MRNVNFVKDVDSEIKQLGFILTMRNVNILNLAIASGEELGFILTMRNVNIYQFDVWVSIAFVLY